MTVRDIQTIYQVPLLLEEQGLRDRLREGLKLDDVILTQELMNTGSALWTTWKKTVATKPHLELVTIALVGKYTALPDSKYFLKVSRRRRASDQRKGCKRR